MSESHPRLVVTRQWLCKQGGITPVEYKTAVASGEIETITISGRAYPTVRSALDFIDLRKLGGDHEALQRKKAEDKAFYEQCKADYERIREEGTREISEKIAAFKRGDIPEFPFIEIDTTISPPKITRRNQD
jgi:hypothetical protein